MKPICLALAVLFVVAGSGALMRVSGQAPAPPSLVVLSAAGRRAVPTASVNGREMVALDDLAAVFQVSLRDDPLAGGMTVSYKGRTIALMPDQAIASVGNRLVSLPAPATRAGKRWLVPIEFIDAALALVYDARLELRKTSHLVIVGDLRVPRLTVRQETIGGQARLTFDASPKTSSSVVQEQNRLVVRFDADALDAVLPAGAAPGLVDAVRPGDAPNTIAIALGGRFGSFRSSQVAIDAASSRTIVDVLAAGLPEAAPPAPPAPAPLAPVAPDALVPQAPGVRTIVLDAGHGGADDEGARGPGGRLEKDITLSVARRLKATLENRLGLRVLLTRDGDTAVSLDDRAAFANNNKADLFISLHANASLRKEVKGAEVFYLSSEGYEMAQQAATSKATLPAFGGGSRDIDLILWEVAQTQHLAQSASLAAAIEEQLRAHVPMSTHPVQQAPFRVLVGANMPAVLVEMAFITNPEQEAALASDEFQNGIAQAVFDAIVRFRDTLERAHAPAPADRVPRPPSK